MDMGFVIELILLAIVIIQFIVMILFFSKNRQDPQVTQRLTEYTQRLERSESTLRDEFGKNREEINKVTKESREEMSLQLNTTNTSLTGLVDNKMKYIQESLNSGLKDNREELNKLINTFEEKSLAKIGTLTKETIEGLDKNRAIVDTKLAEIQKNNDEKLEKMREMVDEKLQKTLESRISESFKQVSENLARVQQGLGEMQNLAADVGGLKNVLANVKNRGTFGEFQLGNILEEMLSKSQYEEQVAIKPNSKERVDYAIKIPSKDDDNGFIWLPIDAKFPTVDFERLTKAYNDVDKVEIDKAIKALADTIKKQAKDISTKYIDSPNTTEFAIMFLPFESLYAEVLRIPGLLQEIQTKHKITIAGPTTISALLASLQMGFKTLNVNKRTGEISKLLSVIKQEFGKFEIAFEKAKEKIDSASQYLEDKIGKQTRRMANELEKVDALPTAEANKLLAISQDDEDDNA
jgi:DNA recombination protein RmuC